MNRDAIIELFDYTGWAWDRIARVIDEQPSAVYAKPVEGSGWPSLAGCVTHFVAAYDGWLNMPWGGVEVGKMTYPAAWPAPVEDWTEMKAYRLRCRQAFSSALDVPDEALYAKRRYDLGDGPDPEMLSRADILANLVVHERGHHGDLNTLFHQLGIRSYFIDYRFFRSLPGEFIKDEGDPG